jgi:hypothetical protein
LSNKKYIPVPRTLSEAVLKVATGPLDPSQLLSPEELMSHMPLIEPEELFKNVTVRPPEPERSAHIHTFKSPEQVFGSQAIAPAGEKLLSPKKILGSKHKTHPKKAPH